MRINNNLMAMNTHRQLGINSDAGAKSIEKLSSGLRINRAGDDAAGLAISEKMRAQIRGLGQASRNAQDSISLVQTAEGALSETQSILQRMRELAVQSANDTNVSKDRSAIQSEVDQLATEITRIANNTEFNERKLLDGGIKATGVGDLTFHIGANADQNVQMSIGAMDAKTLNVSRDVVTGATGTVAGDISGATFTGTEFGAGVAQGNVVTATYTAAVAGNAGSVSVVTGAANAGLGTLAGLADETLSVTVGAKTYTLGTASLKAWNGDATHDDLAEAAVFLGNASDGAGGKLSDVVNITNTGVGGKLVLTAKNPGASAITVAVTGTTPATVQTTFGLNNAQTNTGAAVVTAESAKITLTSTLGHNQTVNIADPAAIALSVTTGSFKGMNFTTIGGKTLADMGAGDTITIATTSQVAAAATFNNGALTSAAVTGAGIDISTRSNANIAISTINTAITSVSDERAKLGAVQNRLEHTIKNLDTSSENLQASESRIRDVDMAKEMMNFTKNNILQQAAQAMLAQANQAPQGVLQLLR